jgi:hypothetical protein
VTKAAVLGCGPAGLLAAHALYREHDIEPSIYAKGPRSEIHGAQYLHVPVPGLTQREPDAMLTFQHWGVCEEYAMKVYGDAAAPCSWRAFGDEVPIWSMQRIYGELWMLYKDLITFVNLTSPELAMIEDTHDLIVSTVPAHVLCLRQEHNFEQANVWVTDSAQERVPFNGIVLNGIYDDPWYRSSDVLGYRSTEWPGTLFDYQIAELDAGARVRVTKPLRTNCTCRPQIVRAGRFGEWKKGVLVHHAYDKVREVLNAV